VLVLGFSASIRIFVLSRLPSSASFSVLIKMSALDAIFSSIPIPTVITKNP